MNENRIMLLAVVGSIFISLMTVSSCASTGSQKARPSKAETVRKAKKAAPKNYSLYSNKEIDWRLIRRGKKNMGGPALDSY